MSDPSEQRITSSTGGEKGRKLARYDLVPAAPLHTLAELYGKGAEKYSKYGDCICAASAPSTPAASAEAATSATFGDEILNTQSGNGSTPAHGITPTPGRAAGNSQSSSAPIAGLPSTGFRSTSTPRLSGSLVGSAGLPSAAGTPTTNTAPIESAGHSVTAATSGLASSSSAAPNGRSGHSPGCPATQVVSSGDRNWERGYDWSLSFAALNRHLWLFWQGVNIDDETGLPHLAAVVFHAFALMEFANTHPEFDDRPIHAALSEVVAATLDEDDRETPQVSRYIEFDADDREGIGAPMLDATAPRHELWPAPTMPTVNRPARRAAQRGLSRGRA